tara:strand:+ start:79 stop:420 length:342 start_codon:yes stop_codon:yes gene_type:complete
MKAICIDSSNKPEGISEYEWLEEGMVYTITEVVEMALQDGKLGVAVEEVKLTEASAPYKYYSLERFLLVPEQTKITFENIMSAKHEILERVHQSIEDQEIDAYAENADLTNSI